MNVQREVEESSPLYKMLILLVTALLLVVALTGCATQAQLPSLGENFRSEMRDALAQRLVEQQISALKAARPPDRAAAMRRDAAVLHVALTGRPSAFAAESKALLTTIADMRLHEIPVEVQVLAHLSARILGADNTKVAAVEIRQVVEGLCGPRTRERYAAMPGDLVARRRALFEASAAAACFSAVSGRETEAYLGLVDAVEAAYGDAALQREWAEAGLDRSTAAATKLFAARLRRRHGIDLHLLLNP